MSAPGAAELWSDVWRGRGGGGGQSSLVTSLVEGRLQIPLEKKMERRGCFFDGGKVFEPLWICKCLKRGYFYGSHA